ncbi:MAG: hypothetical protein ACKV2T_28910 [Kofleriaceae bacterium]
MRSPLLDGARFRPQSSTWQPTTTDDAPTERDDHVAVWTGTEMIIWGGNSYDEDSDRLDTGARYDPVADQWIPMPSLGLTGRDDPRAVWTGREMLVWGGHDASGHTATGAHYDPTTNRVRPIPTASAPRPREDHTMVWTGTEMIVWGGWNGDDRDRNYALDSARYDPQGRRWRSMSTKGAPQLREDHTAIWTGTEMIVWGGAIRRATSSIEPTEPTDRTNPKAVVEHAVPHQLGTGGRYRPATDSWAPISMEGAPSPREDDVVVWTGDEMIVWGGQSAGRPLATGARYIPAEDRWCPLPLADAPAARSDLAGVWTGDALIVWGGGADGEFLASGAMYLPRGERERLTLVGDAR